MHITRMIAAAAGYEMCISYSICSLLSSGRKHRRKSGGNETWWLISGSDRPPARALLGMICPARYVALPAETLLLLRGWLRETRLVTLGHQWGLIVIWERVSVLTVGVWAARVSEEDPGLEPPCVPTAAWAGAKCHRAPGQLLVRTGVRRGQPLGAGHIASRAKPYPKTQWECSFFWNKSIF